MFNLLSCTGTLGVDAGSLDDIARITSLVVTLIQVVVPILLVIWGMLDLGKAVTAQKDDEIKKGQQTLVKRAITAAIVFFVVSIVKLLLGIVAKGNTGVSECFDCFINGPSTTSSSKSGKSSSSDNKNC